MIVPTTADLYCAAPTSSFGTCTTTFQGLSQSKPLLKRGVLPPDRAHQRKVVAEATTANLPPFRCIAEGKDGKPRQNIIVLVSAASVPSRLELRGPRALCGEQCGRPTQCSRNAFANVLGCKNVSSTLVLLLVVPRESSQ